MKSKLNLVLVVLKNSWLFIIVITQHWPKVNRPFSEFFSICQLSSNTKASSFHYVKYARKRVFSDPYFTIKILSFWEFLLCWWVVVSSLVIKRSEHRSSFPEVFLGKGALKICSKFTGENLCRSAISIKLQSNFILKSHIGTGVLL